ncbi:MAG: TonB-dependent receptor [Bacteroidales bacterium]
MKTNIQFLLFIIAGLPSLMFAQNQGKVQGKVFDLKNNEPIPFATDIIQGTTEGSVTDENGFYLIDPIPTGFIKLQVNYVGYQTTISSEIQIRGKQTVLMDIGIQPLEQELKEVVVKQNLGIKKLESPLSLQILSVQEIEKSAGANRDVSKVLQNLPGVASTAVNRNDLIVRGGGPAENVFFLDAVEIPVINHFSTQGASGGSVGILNPNFIREINFYSGAFPANRGNALSSAMDIIQRDGNSERIHGEIAIGASDAGITIEGPIGKKSSFIASVRQSYLQLLFQALQLPFLPNYNDFQVKYKVRFNTKRELTFIGLGAIDRMNLNLKIKHPDEGQSYLLGYLPEYRQWNYTVGFVYKHFDTQGFGTIVLSRNMLHNAYYKYPDNDKNQNRILDYASNEAENKVRYQYTFTKLPFNFYAGAGINLAHYTNKTAKIFYNDSAIQNSYYQSLINNFSYRLFAQASDDYLDNRLRLALGIAFSGNLYNSNMMNPLRQLAPRFSLSYTLAPWVNLNFNMGRYCMSPSYTSMGIRNIEGVLLNKNKLKYIMSNQVVGGFEFRPMENMKLSVEGFFKYYQNYPISLIDSVSLACKGNDFGTVGDEPLSSIGKGRAYGVEFYYKISNIKNLNLSLAYTLFWSEFTNLKNQYKPSAWDTRHLINLSATYRFKYNWTLGIHWQFSGGAPYSPIDMLLSSNRLAWDARRQVYPDYARYNSERLKSSHQLDIRIDKEFFFNKWALNLYIDIQNVYNFQAENPPLYINTDVNGIPAIIDPSLPIEQQSYELRALDNAFGTILPTLGIMFMF